MNKTCFAALLALLPSTALAAGARDDVVQGIVRCGTITDDRQWLDCIYGAAQPMRAQLGLSPAPQMQQRLVPAQGYGTLPGYGGTAPPAPAYAAPIMPVTARPPARATAPPPQEGVRVERQPRGFFDRMLGTSNVPTITARLSSYSFGGGGHFTVTLVNGQVWAQTPGDLNVANWKRPAYSYTVTISPGAFGTYNLAASDEANIYKVKRIK